MPIRLKQTCLSAMLVLLVAAVGTPARGQSTALPGHRIRVLLEPEASRSIVGIFVRRTADTLVLRAEPFDYDVPLLVDHISGVEMSAGRYRATRRGALIGLATGMAVGVALAYADDRNRCRSISTGGQCVSGSAFDRTSVVTMRAAWFGF